MPGEIEKKWCNSCKNYKYIGVEIDRSDAVCKDCKDKGRTAKPAGRPRGAKNKKKKGKRTNEQIEKDNKKINKILDKAEKKVGKPKLSIHNLTQKVLAISREINIIEEQAEAKKKELRELLEKV